MIRYIINEMLGPLGRATLDLYFAHQTLLNGIFLLWATIMTAASIQLRRIKGYTVSLIQAQLRHYPNSSDKEILDAILPYWAAAVPRLGRFVPNRWDLWIQRPTPDHVARLLKLSPAWVSAVRTGGKIPRDALTLPTPVAPVKEMGRRRGKKARAKVQAS